MTNHTTISIPRPLYKQIKETIGGTGFTSASDFVTFVLREVLSEAKGGKGRRNDRKTVVEKLRNLGYIE